MTEEQEYLASEWWPDRADGPIDLWRKQGDELESFSREDLGWHGVARDDLSWQLDGRALSPVDQMTAEAFIRRCRGVHDAPDIEADPVGSSFVVAETFDIAARAGLLVSGRLQFGVVRQGETLYSATTAEPVPVLAVEFPTPREPAGSPCSSIARTPGWCNLAGSSVPRAARRCPPRRRPDSYGDQPVTCWKHSTSATGVETWKNGMNATIRAPRRRPRRRRRPAG